MSKPRKGRRNRNINNSNDNNNSNNQIFDMLNNIDPNQISNLLSNMGLDSNMGNNQKVHEDNTVRNTPKNISEQDKTLQVLKILKSMANTKESEIIDKMMKVYTITKILNE